MKKIIRAAFAIVILVLAGWLIYEFLLFFNNADKEIKAALIGLFGITLAAVFSHYFAQKREIASRQFSQKVKAYENIFDLIFELIKGVKDGRELSEKEMSYRGIKIKRDLLIWAGENVLKAWRDYECEAEKGEHANVFRYMDRIFRALRRELGHRDTTLAEGDLVKWLVRASDHSLIDEQMTRRAE